MSTMNKPMTLSRYRREKKILIFLFLLIPMLLLLTFTVYPVIAMLYYSFTNWNGYGPPSEYVGFANYTEIFTNPKYWTVFENSLYYLVAGLIQQLIGLLLAALLLNAIKFGNFFKGVIFFPFLINTVAVSLIFLMFYEKGGILDSVLTLFGLEHLSKLWMADSAVVKFSLAFTSLWKNFGYSFVIYLGAMQSVPNDIFEAADIDGANGWQKFRFITFPTIKMVVGLMTLLTVVGSVSVFELPFIMTKGLNDTNTFLTTTIDVAFTYSQFGLASALSIVLLLILTIIVVIRQLLFKEDAL